MSIGRICDNGNSVLFTKERGVVKSPSGKEICTFDRDKGLYIAHLKASKGTFTAPNGKLSPSVQAKGAEPGFTGQGVTA